MGGVSIVLYVVMNYVSNGNAVIEDSVSALGVWIAFYYGLTGLSCVLVLPRARWARAPQPVAARHPAAARLGHAVVRHVLGLLVLLATRSTATRR